MKNFGIIMAVIGIITSIGSAYLCYQAENNEYKAWIVAAIWALNSFLLEIRLRK